VHQILTIKTALLLICGCKGTEYFSICQTFCELFSKKDEKRLEFRRNEPFYYDNCDDLDE